MKAKLSKKSLTMALSMILVLSLAVGGTFAWISSTSEAVVNKFQDNDVDVTLEETKGNAYNIMPGTEEEKDPKVTLTTTMPTYLYVEIDDNTQGLVTWAIAEGWTKLEGYDNVYWREVNGEDSPYNFPVLKGNKVSYSSALTKEQIRAGKTAAGDEGLYLSFTPYAIQKAPFNDPVKAWEVTSPETVSSQDELKEALAAGKSVILAADIVLTEQINVTDNAVLDLNGHTLSNNNDIWNDADGVKAWSLISVQGGDLLITGNGTLQAKENDCFPVDVRDDGKLTIENGTFVGNIHAVYVYEGSAEIRGGTFSVQQKYPDSAKADEFVVNLFDANRVAGTASAVITGGSFVGFNPADNASEGPHTNYVVGNHTVTEADGVFTVA